MPISLKVLQPRASEAGKIKIGQMRSRKGAGKIPQKLETKEGPFFIITKTLRGQDDASNFVIDARLMKELEPYADEDSDKIKRLRQIPIRLDSDVIEQIAPTRLAMYRGTNLFCSGTGDGKNAATRWSPLPDGTSVSAPHDCPCPYLRAKGDEVCKPNLILWCTIDAGGETRLGVRHAFRTTGWNSIKSILAGLSTIQEQVGTLVGPKLWLCVKWELKKDAKGTSRKVPVVYVECRTHDLAALRRDAVMTERARLEVVQLRNPRMLGLPVPAVNETPATQQAVATEWYPSQSDRVDEDDAQDDQDEAFYDDDTGEVYDDVDGSGEYKTVTPQMPRSDPPAEGAERQPEPTSSDRPVWHGRLSAILKRVASIRDLPATQESMREVLAQVTTEKFGKSIPFGQLTLEQAGVVDAILYEEIRKKSSEVLTPP